MRRSQAPDIRYLPYVEVVARLGSFRRAARELGVDQATVSRRVQAIEDRVGIALFERSRHGARLTALGGQFLTDAGLAVSQLRRALEQIEAARLKAFRIGIVTSLASSILRSAITQFIQENAGTEVSVRVGAVADHLADLRSGNIEVAFLPHRKDIEGCRALPLWREHAVVALPAHHRLASAGRIGSAELAMERFIFGDNGALQDFKDWFAHYADRHGISVQADTHHVGRDDLMGMISIGMGISIFCSSVAETSYPGVVFSRLETDENVLWSIVWPSRGKSPLVPKLISAIQSNFSSAHRG